MQFTKIKVLALFEGNIVSHLKQEMRSKFRSFWLEKASNSWTLVSSAGNASKKMQTSISEIKVDITEWKTMICHISMKKYQLFIQQSEQSERIWEDNNNGYKTEIDKGK